MYEPPDRDTQPEPSPGQGSPPLWDRQYRDYVETQRRFYDTQAPKWDAWRRLNLGYHQQIVHQYQLMVPPDAHVLEIGCATGELLASLAPSQGVGVDISPRMIEQAREKSADKPLEFVAGPIEEWDPEGRQFDFIILSDVVGLLRDIELVFDRLCRCCHARTRLILNFHSHVWVSVFGLAEKLKLKAPSSRHNWITREDVIGLLRLTGFEPIRQFSRILMPKRIPPISGLFNRFFARFIPFRWFCMSNFVVARVPVAPFEKPPQVTVVCPCRNEAGNIEKIVSRLPQMGARTELIFVEGGSRDDTYERCLEIQKKRPDRDIKVYQQTGRGKGDAVRLGYAKAGGDILMILDADMTVPPEDLPRFYRAIANGTVEFVNGSRLVYPMGTKAMRFLNLCANKFFAWAFSAILEQDVKDTLCGTKVLMRSDYERIAAGRAYFGHLDPFGDFDLLFGAAKLNLRIQDLPIIYRDRDYGATNISRFSHGWLLLKMAWLGLWRLKCR
ncbi:MAG: glycosyltransferase [Planctomycetota bacterium]|jgi:ubiquinone/menaquinone biosynthesis C-methylase UbiE